MAINPAGAAVPVQCTTLWKWDTSGASPVVSGYPQGNGAYTPTKTGLTPTDLQNFVGVPIAYYGNPPVPVASGDIQSWLRYAEDTVEQETSILLCQTWVAASPAVSPWQVQSTGLIVNSPLGIQQQGYDYDLAEPAYDFYHTRWQDSGWGEMQLRYKPLQSTAYNVSGSPATVGLTAMKAFSFVYPLLNTFYSVPPSWFVEDHDFSLVRVVPATSVQMIPLFAMQLSFLGFSEDVPGGIVCQYTAGLTPFDYQSRFSFMKELVLATAAVTALSAVQGTINLGAEGLNTMVDGLQMQFKYPAAGPYAGLIKQFTTRRELLKKIALTKVSGPMLTML